MDDQQLGWTLRSIRTKKRWRQSDLAERARASRWVVMRIERGRIDGVPVSKVRQVAAALDARVAMHVRWQGGDLGRLVNARHAAMHEVMARYVALHSPWIAEPEVSLSIWGERGTIDILAWHPDAQALLVIELKTEIVDLNGLLGTLDRKRRLASEIAAGRGLTPASVGVGLSSPIAVRIAGQSPTTASPSGTSCRQMAVVSVDGLANRSARLVRSVS